MTMPRAMASFNRAVTNRFARPLARRVPPYAVVVHHGRRTGRVYETPVAAWLDGDRVAIAVLYGPESDWVRNVCAGDGELIRRGQRRSLENPRLVDPDDVAGLSRTARRVGRTAGTMLVARVR